MVEQASACQKPQAEMPMLPTTHPYRDRVTRHTCVMRLLPSGLSPSAPELHRSLPYPLGRIGMARGLGMRVTTASPPVGDYTLPRRLHTPIIVRIFTNVNELNGFGTSATDGC